MRIQIKEIELLWTGYRGARGTLEGGVIVLDCEPDKRFATTRAAANRIGHPPCDLLFTEGDWDEIEDGESEPDFFQAKVAQLINQAKEEGGGDPITIASMGVTYTDDALDELVDGTPEFAEMEDDFLAWTLAKRRLESEAKKAAAMKRLDSVGSFVDIENGIAYPMGSVRGKSLDELAPDLDNPTHLDDVEEDWFGALSPEDRLIVDSAKR